jgi:hypothetical protein
MKNSYADGKLTTQQSIPDLGSLKLDTTQQTVKKKSPFAIDRKPPA